MYIIHIYIYILSVQTNDDDSNDDDDDDSSSSSSRQGRLGTNKWLIQINTSNV